MKFLGLGIPELLILAAIIIPIVIIVVVVKKRTKKSEQRREETAAQATDQTASESMPAIEEWKPAPGFSVLGALVGSPALAFAQLMVAAVVATVAGDFVGSIVSLLLWFGIRAAYALVVYPSYFTSKPLVKSSKAISFLNYSVGWVIFGALWNSNLRCSSIERRPKKGCSHIVFTVLAVLYLLYLCV